MNQVKSPYNFVPAPTEDQVFKPSWATLVSHDIPFEDGESGEIEIEITAETPVFIRDGQKKDEKSEEFSHYEVNGQKQYFIPATSLKGMVRNVLEIMSFSRLAPVTLGNTIFGLRDMNNPQYLKEEIKGNKPGWLIFENGKWVIKPTNTDRVTIKSIINNFSKHSSWDKSVSFSEVSAKEKYKLCGLKSFDKKFDIKWSHAVDKTGDIFELDKTGDYDGYLVMYGAMDNKKYEYVFEEPENRSIELIDQNLVKKITDYEEGNPDSLWNYFYKELQLKKIPIFYKENPQTKRVTHFGFSKLYRLNNAHYLKDLSPVSTYPIKDYKPDLTETIFGNISSNTGALKGRVYFSHALAKGIPKEVSGQTPHEILGSPKPSYYPYYLKQKNPRDNSYSTYQSETSELRGFKKYHITDKATQNTYTQEQKDSESMVNFRPLEAGTKFVCKLRYHNLKPLELGSLLSALTYHKNHDQLRHNLGMAKSKGYGRIKMDVKIDPERLKNYLQLFETEINDHSIKKFNKKWVETDQIKDLGSLAKACTDYARLNFPQLEVEIFDQRKGRKVKANEFNKIKEMFDFLKAPSEYQGSYFQIKSLL